MPDASHRLFGAADMAKFSTLTSLSCRATVNAIVAGADDYRERMSNRTKLKTRPLSGTQVTRRGAVKRKKTSPEYYIC